MSATILEALQNADYNISNGQVAIARMQLHNATLLLTKGYPLETLVEPLLQLYTVVENVPDFQPPAPRTSIPHHRITDDDLDHLQEVAAVELVNVIAEFAESNQPSVIKDLQPTTATIQAMADAGALVLLSFERGYRMDGE